MWVFALVIIFFALIFWARRDDGHKGNYGDGVLPALAVGGIMEKKCHSGASHEIWDIERDQMREFANVRQEIKETGWEQQRENTRYFYENRAAIDRNNYDTLLGFKNNEILGLQSKSDIMARIDTLERTFKEDEIRKQGNRINYLETVLALQPKPIPPSYPVGAPIPLGNPCWA
jgi:hypothetical protein